MAYATCPRSSLLDSTGSAPHAMRETGRLGLLHSLMQAAVLGAVVKPAARPTPAAAPEGSDCIQDLTHIQPAAFWSAPARVVHGLRGPCSLCACAGFSAHCSDTSG